MISWLMEGITLYLLIKIIEPSNLSILGASVAHNFGGLFGAISMIPGGLGTTEISMISILKLQGVSISIATTCTFVIRIMTLWFATLLGIVSLIYIKNRGDFLSRSII